MHDLLREHLEGYLAGHLPSVLRQQLDAHLAQCPECRREWEAHRGLSKSLQTLRAPASLEWEPLPGFYARVMDRVDAERVVPFWALLIDPDFGRRLVFACLVLLAILGGYFAAFQPVDYSNQHRPEAILAGQPAPFPTPRLGPNLERNRNAMLATLVSDRR
jgi:anti-sigma factor RsiW